MIGLGTIINVALILVGGLIGLACGRFITPGIQDTLLKAIGLCVIFIGVAGTLEEMMAVEDGALVSGGTAMMIISFTLGSIVGEALDLDARMEGLGEWLKRKTGSSGDASFVDGFVTASLTVCVGAMAIVGSIQDGLLGDWSTLALKGALDAIVVCVMTASMGKGCIFSALPVAVLQGTVTALAGLLEPIMTDAALSYLSLTGNMLIFCVGANLIWGKLFKPANMLPAIVVAVVYALVMG